MYFSQNERLKSEEMGFEMRNTRSHVIHVIHKSHKSEAHNNSNVEITAKYRQREHFLKPRIVLDPNNEEIHTYVTVIYYTTNSIDAVDK